MCHNLTNVVVGRKGSVTGVSSPDERRRRKHMCLLEIIKTGRTTGAFARLLVYSTSPPILFSHPVLLGKTDVNTTGLSRLSFVICSSALD